VAATKATYPALIGLEASRKEANRLTQKALQSLVPLGSKAERLRQIADHLLNREY
jgi:geranylgeranyl diphosphate synthase type II